MSTPKRTKPKHVWIVEFLPSGRCVEVQPTRHEALAWVRVSIAREVYRVAKYVRAT